ncbi:MAG: MBL fold metallo-hydrolase [Spirochaetota bacterium]
MNTSPFLARVCTAACAILICILSSCSRQDTAVVHPLDSFFTSEVSPSELSWVRLSDNSSSVLMKTRSKTILIDPGFLLPDEIECIKRHGIDMLLYTHEHADHFEKNGARELMEHLSPVVVIEPALKPHFDGISAGTLIVAETGTEITHDDVTITPFTGYHGVPITLFGIVIDGISIFHGGDSGYVKTNGYRPDIAFVPTGEPSPTCSPDEAFRMISDLQPSVAVPFHGLPRQDETFAKLVTDAYDDIAVIISRQYEIRTESL